MLRRKPNAARVGGYNRSPALRNAMLHSSLRSGHPYEWIRRKKLTFHTPHAAIQVETLKFVARYYSGNGASVSDIGETRSTYTILQSCELPGLLLQSRRKTITSRHLFRLNESLGCQNLGPHPGRPITRLTRRPARVRSLSTMLSAHAWTGRVGHSPAVSSAAGGSGHRPARGSRPASLQVTDDQFVTSPLPCTDAVSAAGQCRD
ncbi:hypothetical protein J2Z50_004367 [Ensifer mexicanus]|nr:hypothetical protein [Sinorhizobium mexicanum]